MKLQSKFYLGVIVVFGVLAVVIAVVSVDYVNRTTIREAENRVRIYARAAWEIHNGTIEQIRSVAEVLSQRPSIESTLLEPADEQQLEAQRAILETTRQEQGLDVLDLVSADGTAILRSRSPYNRGDRVADDPFVEQVLITGRSSAGNAIWSEDRMQTEAPDLAQRCMLIDQDPRGMISGAAVPVLKGGQLIGIVEAGILLNGSVEEVDRIRNAVFENETYAGKPVGTATIFMDSLRVSTNVLNAQRRRAVGTRVSQEVADHVLSGGLSWTGRAFVVDTWYLSQYDPIRDPDGAIIGMMYVGELEQKYLDLRTRAVTLYLSVILGGMVAAFVVAFLITRGILGPIRTLLEATRSISNGDFTYRVGVKSGDEVGKLSASFNQMAEDLERQRQEIIRNQQDLEVLNRDLQATNRNYMEMLGFVAHELKNPLTSAVMSLYTVKDGFLGEVNAAQQKSLDSVAQSLDYFHDMIRNYLDLSRLEKGELEVSKTGVMLQAQIIAPVLDGLKGEIESRCMTVDNRVPEALEVQADPNLLRIVYNNLLSNAVKYGRENGKILLEARRGIDRVTLSVRNDGPGIPQEKRAMLFRKFSRLDTDESSGKRGTGLGLYICKEVIEKQGGEIWADSRDGEWVKFSFTLPD